MNRVFPAFVGGRGAVGLLALRMAMGAAFVLHGLSKIYRNGEFVMLHWMPPEAPVPPAVQAAAAVAEFGGGLGLIFGLLTPLAGLGILCTMATAIAMVHTPTSHPFVGPPDKGPYELPLVYLASAVLFILVGPGRISLDWLLFGRAAPAPPGDYPRTVPPRS